MLTILLIMCEEWRWEEAVGCTYPSAEEERYGPDICERRPRSNLSVRGVPRRSMAWFYEREAKLVHLATHSRPTNWTVWAKAVISFWGSRATKSAQSMVTVRDTWSS